MSEATAFVEANEIRDEAVPHVWFTQIPNLVDEMNLSPYAIRLYLHMKRVTGETTNGRCWQSTRTLAKASRMSIGSVVKAKQELQSSSPPLIKVKVEKIGKEKFRHIITIRDIWPENHKAYRES